MNAETKKKRIRYPFDKSGVYISVVIAVLSVILTLVLYAFYQNPFMLVAYVAFTIPMTLLIFKLKILIFSTDTTSKAKSDSLDEEDRGYSKRRLLLVFCLLVLAVVLPLLLAALLDPMTWFVSLVSFASSASISEIVLYFYSR